MVPYSRRQNAVDAVMKSYEDLGVINGSEGFLVPSRTCIQSIILLVRELLFPGFFGTGLSETEDLALVTGRRVVTLIELLSEEIYKSLVWDVGVNQASHGSDSHCKAMAMDATMAFMEEIPTIRALLKGDAQTLYEGDPASTSLTEIILAYPGFQAVLVYRVAHFLFLKQVPIIPRLMSELAHSETGIDIHPGAKIGHSFFIDHGTGIVIGETSVIGNHVKLYQGVTLGAFSVSKTLGNVKRHPTLEDGVTVYAHTTILGGTTVIGEGSTIGGNVWLTESVPPQSKIYLSPDFKSSMIMQVKASQSDLKD